MAIIGLDIGGTKCAVVRATDSGRIMAVETIPTSAPRPTLEALFRIVEDMAPGDNPLFGVSCGSPLDHEAGVILSPPNLPGWDRIEIVHDLTKRFGGRAWLMNDANAGALAEWRFGAGRQCRNVIFLTAGTGMGAGLILDGRLYEGTGGHAGEVGHTRLEPDGPVGYGKAGSFEGLCSGGGIGRVAQDLARDRGDESLFGAPSLDEISARHVAEAARAGDETAVEILSLTGRRLGRALAVLVDILNPQCIVLGSVFVRCEDFLRPAMAEALAEEALPQSLRDCRVEPAQLGENIGNVAAVSVALYRSARMNETAVAPDTDPEPNEASAPSCTPN